MYIVHVEDSMTGCEMTYEFETKEQAVYKCMEVEESYKDSPYIVHTQYYFES